MKPLRKLAVLVGLFALTSPSHAQEGFFSSWEDRVRSTVAEQPAWPTALFTSNAGLVQLARTDFIRQITPSGVSAWNYDGGKGLDLIPWYKTEFDVTLPPYIDHNVPGMRNGFGDVTMLLKYRVLSNSETGNYAMSVGVTGTIPTGSYSNGSKAGLVSPTLYGGKGFRNFDVQSNLSAALPTGFTTKLGRPVGFNTVAQYRVFKLFWPQVENNATYYRGGSHAGKTQDFVTPGMMISRIKLEHEATSRLSLTFGVGEQIAVSHYHGYNHAGVLSTRLNF